MIQMEDQQKYFNQEAYWSQPFVEDDDTTIM